MSFQPWFLRLAFLAVVVGSCDDASAQLGGLLGRAPSVEIISTSELAKKLNQRQDELKKARESGRTADPADFVLVDVRSEEEIEVSVIPGAITKAIFEKDRKQYQSRLVIPYCTIGGRSGMYARQLEKDGFTVKNYEGSILDWVKNDLPLVTLDGKPTNRVHTYSPRYKVPPKYEAIH